MRHVPRVFLEAPLTEGAELELSGDPAHHLLNVLRLKAGAELILFNGAGGEFEASVTQTGKRRLTVRAGRHRAATRESPLALTLAQAVTRSERMDYAIQKAVELGATAIQPLLTEYSLQLDGERSDRKLAHWRAIARSAAEQSGRERVPEVAPLLSLADWLQMVALPAATARLVLHPGGAGLKSLERVDRIVLVVGPEGGLGEKDLQRLSAADFRIISLGPRILRTETAGAAALAALQTLWGDLG